MDKLLVRAPMRDADLAKLKGFFKTIIYKPWTETGERFYENEMIECLLCEQPDALITELDVINEKVLAKYSKLKFIGDCRATPENIDVEACNKRRIPILCTPARNANAVAEMWLSCLIAFERNMVDSVNWVREKNWVKGTTPYYLWMGNEISRTKIGFVGFGAVAQRIVHLLQGFDVDILYYDPFVGEQPGCTNVELDQLFSQSDYVSIHLPANKETIGLIDAALLRKMRPSSVFINSSRSAVVDNQCLYELVQSKAIRGAILDVLDTEPPVGAEQKVGEISNILLTPHTYGASYQVVDHQSQIITNNIINFFNCDKNGDVQ